jgi:hypothetical protein
MKKKYLVQGISFPDENLFQAAKARAASQRRTLSNYICGLLEADLQGAGRGGRVIYPSAHEPQMLNEPAVSSAPPSALAADVARVSAKSGRGRAK